MARRSVGPARAFAHPTCLVPLGQRAVSADKAPPPLAFWPPRERVDACEDGEDDQGGRGEPTLPYSYENGEREREQRVEQCAAPRASRPVERPTPSHIGRLDRIVVQRVDTPIEFWRGQPFTYDSFSVIFPSPRRMTSTPRTCPSCGRSRSKT